MPPDPQGTEAGPSTAGGAFRLFDGPSKVGTDVRISQPDLLKSRSLKFKKLMEEKRETQQIPLRIDPSPDIDAKAVEWVVENLQRQKPKADPDPKGLARHCTVLWEYECIPDPFKGLGESMQPRSSSGSLCSADQQSSIGPSTSPNGSSRCWQGKKKCHTCRHLITIAIVLGLQELLENEIRTAIWGTNKEMALLVPLELDIKAIRKLELQRLFICVYEEITEISDSNGKLAKSIRETLKQHNLGDFSKSWRKNENDLVLWTPYDFLRGVENALSSPEQQIQEQEPATLVGVRELPPINWEGLVHKVKESLHMNGIGLAQQKKDAILELLENHIRERQRELAEEWMKRRNSTVQRWKYRLAWREEPLDQDSLNQTNE